MLIFHHIYQLQKHLDYQQQLSKTIGFVPTMGALHKGHISLIEQSKQQTDITVCSIFVNPTQFNDPKDFEKYPVTIDTDTKKLLEANCDVLFLPTAKEIYPNGIQQLEHYNLGFIETVLDGKFRPGHFQGVCQVVYRLLAIVNPQFLFLGQKDYQQCMVIQKMIDLTGLRTSLIVCPTLREHNGLAMSSRNMRLSQEQRAQASAIHETLQMMKKDLQPGDLSTLEQKATALLTAKGLNVDYTEIADGTTLELLQTWNGTAKTVGLIAAFLGDVRLIDNMILSN
jgi:pantoate--beta-alanine ligase